MAEISTYSNSAPVVGTDKLLGSDASGSTKNFSASDLASYVLGSSNGAVTTKTGAVTLSAADVNTFILYGTASGTLTTPASSDTTIPIGAVIQIQFTVSGSCTVAPGSGCSITGTATLSNQYQVKTLKRISSTVYTIF